MTTPHSGLGRAGLAGALLVGLVHSAVLAAPGDGVPSPAPSVTSETPCVLLRAPQPAVRLRALDMLTRLSPAGAADAIVPLLRDPEPQVRATAVVALGRLAKGTATDGLIVPLLGDSDPEVSLAAGRAIVARGPRAKVVRAVATYLQSPHLHSRIAATEVLRKLRATEAIPDLLRAHDDATDARSRYHIAVTLQALGVETPVGPRRTREIEQDVLRSFGKRPVLVVGTRADTAQEDDAFALFGRKAATLLEQQGLDPVPVMIRSASEFLVLLRTLARHRLETDGLVIFGHGGYDGPIFSRDHPITQIGPATTPARYTEMVRLLRAVVRRGGLVFVQACHSAGASELERDGEGEGPDGRREVDFEARTGKNWARSLAERTPLYVVGIRGKTAVEPPPTLLEEVLAGSFASPDIDVVGPWGRPVPAGFGWLRARAAGMQRSAGASARHGRRSRASIAAR